MCVFNAKFCLRGQKLSRFGLFRSNFVRVFVFLRSKFWFFRSKFVFLMPNFVKILIKWSKVVKILLKRPKTVKILVIQAKLCQNFCILRSKFWSFRSKFVFLMPNFVKIFVKRSKVVKILLKRSKIVNIWVIQVKLCQNFCILRSKFWSFRSKFVFLMPNFVKIFVKRSKVVKILLKRSKIVKILVIQVKLCQYFCFLRSNFWVFGSKLVKICVF